jgi:oligopeptide/dipeptide ABC transporter ATP-binding protein
VRDLSYELRRGETYGLAGESGCGKTTSAKALTGLLTSASVSGDLAFSSCERYDLSDQGPRSRSLGPLRGRRIAITFQEPTTALDPLRRIGVQVAEVVRTRCGVGRRVAASAACELLERVGMDHPDAALRAYPHEMSGGMRQRAVLAMALACEPDVLVADEPTTALDGLLQARVLETLRRIGLESAGALELIAHDLAVLESFADRIAIMHAGRIVEEAPAGELIARPLHPYTKDLLAAAPSFERRAVRPTTGAAATAFVAPGVGCSYGPRCARRADRCGVAEPDVVEPTPGHRVACWRAGEAVA